MNERAIFTIFGGTGNLAYQKLMPAFYQLFVEGKLNHELTFVAIGRRKKSHDEYRQETELIIQKRMKSYNKDTFAVFKENIFYFEMDFANEEDYRKYAVFMEQLNLEMDTGGNQIFYLATDPTAFPEISKNLKKNHFLEGNGFKRAVFEKPFGYDLQTATVINEHISQVFGEENIYRIDHYLGKEMIQNIIMIRFTNQIFKAVWNKDSIDNVQITVKESVGVEERGGYYDHSGALRDMVQNHLLQILALVAMETPINFDTNSIRDEKVKVLKSIQIKPCEQGQRNIVFGQYQGYLQESKVNPESTTETYVAISCEIDQPRWEGVPFFLRTGKNLDGRGAEIVIEFKKEPFCMQFDDANKCELLDTSGEPNLLIIKIQPEEGIYFRINTKKPGSESELMPVSMDYCQSCNIAYRSPEAYERLLNDIIKGDSTLFTRWDEVETAWKLVKNMTNECESKSECMVSYEPGSDGPKEARLMVEQSGRKWWNPCQL